MLTHTAVLLMLCAAPPVKAPPTRPTTDQVGAELQTLIDWEELDDPKATLRDVLTQLRTKYKANVVFDFNDKAFKEAFGDGSKNVRDEVVGKVEAGRQTLEGLLKRILVKMQVGGGGASFLVRQGRIEITTEAAIHRELNLPAAQDGADGEPPPVRLSPMITYLRLDGETLEAACEKIAERAGVTVVIDPRAKAGTAIKARLINIPLDTAMELVADMAGLAVARKANAYYVTTPENAARMKAKGG